ncbi:MAG: chemotaxis protein CheX [Candidatus Scalindua sp.]|nr:chemotaxis protein CheX [Candidatus Scalindua sp.]
MTITTTMYDNVIKEIVDSTQEIFATMIPVEITAGESFYQKEENITTDLISLISFTGEHSGIIALFCNKNIALKITSNMLGIEVTELHQDTKDAIGEVTNMIAGSLKNKVCEDLGSMHLSIPVVIGGASLTISSTCKTHAEISLPSAVTCNSRSTWVMLPFSSEGETFNVGLIIKKND